MPAHIFVMLMASLTLVVLKGRRQFDDILRHIYQNQNEVWKQLGRPSGFFWRADKDAANWFVGSWSRSKCFWRWNTQTPDVLADDAFVLSKLRWVRLNTLISHVGFIAAGIGLLAASLS